MATHALADQFEMFPKADYKYGVNKAHLTVAGDWHHREYEDLTFQKK